MVFGEKKLGVAQGERRYDLPLHQDAGDWFFIGSGWVDDVFDGSGFEFFYGD